MTYIIGLIVGPRYDHAGRCRAAEKSPDLPPTARTRHRYNRPDNYVFLQISAARAVLPPLPRTELFHFQ